MASRARRPPPPRRRGRQPARREGWQWLLVGPGLLTVGVAVALLVAWRVDSGAQTAGEAAAAVAQGPLRPSSGQVPLGTGVSAYSVTYRITEPDAPVQTERKLLERPFYGSDITYDTKGQATSGAVTGPSGAYLFLTSPKPHWGLLETGTYRATGDDHVGAGLALAVAHHLARVLGTRQILGRTCTVVRTGGPVGSTVTAPTGSDYTDICVDDATGQALDEVWLIKGKLARERLATAFDAHPSVTDASFRVDSSGPAVPAGTSGATDVIALGPTDIPKIPVFMAAPAGYQLSGVQDQVTLEQAPGSTQPSESSIIFAHFVSGPDLIDLEQGALSSPPSGSISVRLADGRRATLTIDLVSSYLDINVDNQPIRLEGPDLDALMRAALLVKAQPPAA
jgi:hypothetical protein